jgi:prepilin-type N-terminal cleavage/methylation domain-containing protein/prepilin-type processing-associated H-X9-DG protein
MSLPRTPFRVRASHGFTLIELLTVIAIIGVLTAIIIPVVGRVRESGRAAKCTSNLRTLATTLLLAAQDNRGVFPWGFSDASNASHRPWMYEVGQKYNLTWISGAGAIGRRNHEVYNCPTTGRDGGGTTFSATNPCYGANNTVVGDSRETSRPQVFRPRNLNSIREPSRLILVSDTSSTNDVMAGGFLLNGLDFATTGFPAAFDTIPSLRPGPRHPPPSGSSYAGGAFNAAFVDGHVERIATTDTRLASLEGRRALFVAQ